MYNVVGTIVIGYVMSLVLSGGVPLIKCFTPAQIVILMSIIANFGVISLFWVAILVGTFILIIVACKLYKTLKNIPTSMVLLVKITTGMCLIINEVPNALGLNENIYPKGYTVYALINFVTGNDLNINVNTTLTWVMMTVTLTLLLVKLPQFPWHLLFLMGGIFIG